MARSVVVAVAIWAFGITAVAGAAPIPGGFLSQPTGRSSCINEQGTAHCLAGHGLGSSYGLALDQSGQHAYVTSFNQFNQSGHALGSLAVLDRFQNAASLLQSGSPGACFTTGGVDGCGVARGLIGSLAPVVSPDNKNVYVATQDGLAAFKLDPATGRVTPLDGIDACLNENGEDGCQIARMVKNASSIAVSSNGRFVYVAAYGPVPGLLPYGPTRSGVSVFERDPQGGLSQLTGKNACVAEDGAGGCIGAPGLLGAVSLALAPDGKTLYVGSIKQVGRDDAGAVSALAVDQSTGALSPVAGTGGCIAEGPVAGCEQGRGLLGVTSVIAPDNKTVYAVGHFGDSIAVLRRSSDGRLRQPSTGTDGADGCTSASGSDGCATVPSLAGALTAIASHDGFHVYVGGANTINAFRRTGRGRLVQLTDNYGCIAEGGLANANTDCFNAHGLIDVRALAIDPLDRLLYVATAGNSSDADPGGGVVTLERNARTPPLTITAKLVTKSCRAKKFIVELRAKSPLPVTLSAKIDGRSVGRLPSRVSVRLTITASGYSRGRHRVSAKAKDITGRVRNTEVGFTRCAT